MRTILAAVTVLGCGRTPMPDTRQLQNGAISEDVDRICRHISLADMRYHLDGSRSNTDGWIGTFQCEVDQLDHTGAGIVPLETRGARHPHLSDCAIKLGPARISGPVAPDLPLRAVSDPFLAARLSAAYLGIDPGREYRLEETREGVHLYATQYRSQLGGVIVEQSIDACDRLPDHEAPVFEQGDILTFSETGVYHHPFDY